MPNSGNENEDSLGGQFAGLPMGLLICQPILEVAKGQNALCQVYLDNLFELAFEKSGNDGQGDGSLKARTIKFTLERPVINDGVPGGTQSFTVEAPLLSLVPVPAFTMEETTVQFSMEVKEQTVDKKSKTNQESSSLKYKGWGFTAQISGSVTTQRDHTRQTDKSAKYEIYAKASQQPPAEGMAKLTTIMSSVIEPIETSGGSGT